MTELPERFSSKFKVGPGDCWIWIAHRDHHGYGRFYGQRPCSSNLAHRVAYEYLIGPIPGGLEIDHLCRIRECVNPAHLEPVTHQENMRRSPEFWRTTGIHLTHCRHGHEFNESNTGRDPRGNRVCRACDAISQRRYKARLRASQR